MLRLLLLRLLDARQLGTVEIAHPLAHRRQRQAGQLFVERMMPAGLVNDDKAIAAIAVRKHEAAFVKRGLEPLAPVGMFEAVENGGADFPHIGAEAAGFFFLVAAGRLGPVFRLARAVQLAQPKIFLEVPRDLLEVVFKQAGIDRPHFFKIDAAPSDMHVPLAVRRECGR